MIRNYKLTDNEIFIIIYWLSWITKKPDLESLVDQELNSTILNLQLQQRDQK